MKRLAAAALFTVLLTAAALDAADEPAIRPDPRPADLTTGRRGSSEEPPIRDEPRARDLSSPKTAVGRSTIEVTSLTPEQSERVRAIREKAATEIQTIRDRERAEIMALLTDEQRAQFLKSESEAAAAPARPRRITTLPATTQAAP